MMSTLSSSSVFGSRWFGGLLVAACLCFLCGRTARAQSIYVNNENSFYAEPGPPQFPQIDDTAFDNENIFSVTYNLIPNTQVVICEPWFGTLFYTNNGEMILNAPIPTNAIPGQFNSLTAGVGYQFDLQTENTQSHSMAGTFYNPGTIHCDSILDGNNANIFLFEELFAEFGLTIPSSIGDCFVSATNIINPGFIRIGDGGQLNLNGQYVDLTSANLTLEQGFVTSNNVNATITSEDAGLNTNGYSPFFELTATNATSSFPDNLSLSFPASYFATVQTGPTSSIVRVVFVENANTNVPVSVYIAPSVFANEGALLQWSGTYPDPITGLTDTNYLYLFHYYFNSTNLLPILETGNIPGQLTEGDFANSLWQQATPFAGLPPPSTEGFQNIFGNSLIVTNTYEFFNGTLGGTTVETNSSGTNPSGALTNLPNRLIINAARELKLPLAQITGQNYMSIMATNQFDGSAGALISSPYSDISLGVTNGYAHPLTVSNLLASTIPQWGGTLDEWSARWTSLDINSNVVDYRVMLVYADLTPAITPAIQHMTLTASNLVISDVLNLFGSMYANAQSITLTTNTYGSGATSPDGELDMQQIPPTGWTWAGTFPNLAFLTNDGAIRAPNYVNFASSTAITNIISGTGPVSATNILFEAGGANVAKGSTVLIGDTTYTFTNVISGQSTPYSINVLVGSTFNASLSNLIAAVNFGPGGGVVYGSSGGIANPAATAGSLLTSIPIAGMTNRGFVVTATSAFAGTSGNSIPTSTTATNLMWTNSASLGNYLSGGLPATSGSTNITSSPAPYGAIINNGLLSDQGSTLWVSNFENGAVITNGSGSFQLTALTATMTNGLLAAGGDVSLTANTLEVSNLMLVAGRSLTLQLTNFVTDDDVSNGNVWVIGSTNATGFNGKGLIMPFLPNSTANIASESNSLLGTTISMLSPPPNQTVYSTWAGHDYGANTAGYTNNMALGQLILNSTAPNSAFNFTGVTTGNAIYVDRLILSNYTSLAFSPGTTVLPNVQINTNFTIYYADALASSTVNGGALLDVSYLINGFNTNHLVWLPQYMGYFSSTNMSYAGSVNRLNIGLVNAPIDSNGSGTPNSESSDPVFVSGQIDFRQVRVSSSIEKLTWISVPGATNFVLYATTNWAAWNVYTNFVSPESSDTWPITNIVYAPIPINRASSNCWFRVRIDQDNSILYGQ